MIRTAQRRFAPTVIGITRNSDRHQFGISDRLRRNPQLSLATLARYRKRQTQSSPAAGTRWVEVKESAGRPALGGPASSGLAVALRSGRRIEVGRGFDAPTLAQLLDALERL